MTPGVLRREPPGEEPVILPSRRRHSLYLFLGGGLRGIAPGDEVLFDLGEGT